ncbi:phosphatase PAP2 family protein [[Mycobacterium] crassicus]|uniref:Phosphatase PAP2 family protein n=1 Tax=[Mycobacterium] crassicus TaxID=2872309 RepID=A0ABU5XDH5_9MYCO|nr:phosphatase PAP2 family protein [Mycolicibacter sp. MYC098]MEB3020370.1 phosphatase PAP2 family protein [Mycolicibacter sp. MYC098]
MTPSKVCRWALVSGAAAVAVYALALLGYRQHWIVPYTVDAFASDVSHDIGIAYPAWVWFWDGVSTVFAPPVFRVLAMVAAIVAVSRRRLRTALFLLVTVEATGLLTQVAKDAVDRRRPTTALVEATSSSFPSGHALGVMVGVGALLVAALPVLRRHARLAAVCAGVLVVAGVGAARVALSVHYPSDVLAGWALGWAYLCGWAVLLRPWADGVDPVRPTPQDDLDDQ